jgi:hypothetical protein
MDVELRAKLKDWDLPMGPFGSIEEVYREMEVETHKLGPSAATELAKALVKLEVEDDPLLESLDEFLEIYSRHYPDALGEALLVELRPTGSPSLVRLLGCTSSTKAVTQLKKVLALNEASDDLLEALAGTLGDLGGAEALELLNSLQKRENLSKQVQEEINIALSKIARRRAS